MPAYNAKWRMLANTRYSNYQIEMMRLGERRIFSEGKFVIGSENLASALGVIDASITDASVFYLSPTFILVGRVDQSGRSDRIDFA